MTKRRLGFAAGVLIALLLAVAGYVYGTGGAERFGVQRSPDGKEAIEFYTATRWQKLSGPSGDLVGTVALRPGDNAPIARSAPFAMSGEGEVFWGAAQVQIGTSARFDRQTGRWELLQ